MPVCIAIAMLAAQRAAASLGREPTIILFKLIAVALLTVMALETHLWQYKWIIAPIYLLRTSGANCTQALSRSVLMDFVPKV
jgi:hypothetical protein